MSRRVYLDNAATTPVRQEVLEAMLPFLTSNFGNPSSIHQEGRTTRAAIEGARKLVASLIGASTGEIFFTSGGTESNNMAIKCAVSDMGVKRIITSPAEHHCVKHSVEHLKSMDMVQVDMVKVDQYALPDFDHLEELLAASDTPTLVTIMHANNELGSMLDMHQLSALCKNMVLTSILIQCRQLDIFQSMCNKPLLILCQVLRINFMGRKELVLSISIAAATSIRLLMVAHRNAICEPALKTAVNRRPGQSNATGIRRVGRGHCTYLIIKGIHEARDPFTLSRGLY